MKQTCTFAQSLGSVTCKMPSGQEVILPIIPGILKHPAPEMLPSLLTRPGVAHKYTLEALRKAAWPVLCLFPKEWLRQCLPEANMSPSRADALAFLLSGVRARHSSDL